MLVDDGSFVKNDAASRFAVGGRCGGGWGASDGLVLFK